VENAEKGRGKKRLLEKVLYTGRLPFLLLSRNVYVFQET